MTTKEQLDEYKSMAAGQKGMDEQIREHLEANCPKFKGNESRLGDCIGHLVSVARDILGGKNGDVPDEVCFRICRDYFDDELWNKDAEKPATSVPENAPEKEPEKKTEKESEKVPEEGPAAEPEDSAESAGTGTDSEEAEPGKPDKSPDPHYEGQLDLFGGEA